MDSLPEPIVEVILSFVASGTKKDRRSAMLVQKEWLRLARRTFYPRRTLCFAARNGQLEVVRELLKDKRVDPSANNNSAIRLAIENDHLGVVRELL